MITEHVRFAPSAPLQPEELDLLQRVFDVTCAEVGIEKRACKPKDWRRLC